MITTNEPNPFPLEAASGSRFVGYECNASKQRDQAYFDHLAATLTDRSARAFYQHLVGLDLSDFGCFKAKRPERQPANGY